jgi:hypothetical protein
VEHTADRDAQDDPSDAVPSAVAEAHLHPLLRQMADAFPVHPSVSDADHDALPDATAAGSGPARHPVQAAGTQDVAAGKSACHARAYPRDALKAGLRHAAVELGTPGAARSAARSDVDSAHPALARADAAVRDEREPKSRDELPAALLDETRLVPRLD